MVFGNLSRESGSGVTFTRNPLEPYSSQVRLFGDFTARSQGEDLVGRPRVPLAHLRGPAARQSHLPGMEHSLEKDYPEVYQALLDVARDLVGMREHDPQEIEFTFESDLGQGPLHPAETGHGAGADQGLPVLRHLVAAASGPPVAVGMGVAGGAYSGRVAMNAKQIDRLGGREAGRDHRAAASGHRTRGHRHDHPGVGAADRPGRGHIARGRHRQAPGQDGRGRLPGVGGRSSTRGPPAWPDTS